MARIVDTLRNLLNNDPQKLGQHTLVEERTVDDYLLRSWKWNEGRYSIEKGLKELVDTLNRVSTTLQVTLSDKDTYYILNYLRNCLLLTML